MSTIFYGSTSKTASSFTSLIESSIYLSQDYGETILDLSLRLESSSSPFRLAPSHTFFIIFENSSTAEDSTIERSEEYLNLGLSFIKSRSSRLGIEDLLPPAASIENLNVYFSSSLTLRLSSMLLLGRVILLYHPFYKGKELSSNINHYPFDSILCVLFLRALMKLWASFIFLFYFTSQSSSREERELTFSQWRHTCSHSARALLYLNT